MLSSRVSVTGAPRYCLAVQDLPALRGYGVVLGGNLLRLNNRRQLKLPTEKRKVDSSILSLTTTYGRVRSALTSANAYAALSCPQPSDDRSCPCVTVVRHPLSHADRTPCASGGLFAPNLRLE